MQVMHSAGSTDRHQVTMIPESQASGHHVVMCCYFCHFLPTFLGVSKLPDSENSAQQHPFRKDSDLH